jgi:hypothetical protein
VGKRAHEFGGKRGRRTIIIELYNHGISVCAAKVRFMLEEKGMDSPYVKKLLIRFDKLIEGAPWAKYLKISK